MASPFRELDTEPDYSPCRQPFPECRAQQNDDDLRTPWRSEHVIAQGRHLAAGGAPAVPRMWLTVGACG